LVSRPQGWNLLQQDAKMSHMKGQQFSSFFSKNGELVYCNAVEGPLQELGCAHNPEVWRLFVDSSKFILKAVQQHNGNIHPSIPIAHSVQKKESYENMDLLLKTIRYPKYDKNMRIPYNHMETRQSYGDLTVIWLLLRMQSDYSKFCCFVCEWNSRAKENITKLRMAHSRKLSFTEKVCQNRPIFYRDKIFLSPLHIKLGFMKNFVVTMKNMVKVLGF
jgi:hypothetical protein